MTNLSELQNLLVPKQMSGRQAVRKSILPTLIYLGIILLALWAVPERAWNIRKSGVIVIGLFGAWRYSWQLLHVVRMLIYKKKVFPELRKDSEQLSNKYPGRLFFVIPSYFELPEITVQVFHSIMRECSKLPCRSVVLVVSVGSEAEIKNINMIASTQYDMPNLKIVYMIQKSGKRIAMGHALRAAAREFNRLEEWDDDNENDLVVLMDGDTFLYKGVMEKTLPLFRLKPKLGLVTTNNVALPMDESNPLHSWFELKFIQRNMQFQSHSLSNRVLTATGRFSIYRAPIVFDDEFIRYVETDFLDHWMFGRFRFLMGDDKSTWFFCLKEGWEMLYVPDANIAAIEWRNTNFFTTSVSLMRRWYGNMLRNNTRAIMVGPKKMGFFIWWCIVDQRLTTWTPLVGLTSAILLSIAQSPYNLLFYLIWVVFTRMTMLWVFVLQGSPLKFEYVPLMIYNQWIGPIIKILTTYNLKKQTWSKGKKVATIDSEPDRSFDLVQKSVRYLLIFMNFLILVLFCGFSTKTFSLPPVSYFSETWSAIGSAVAHGSPHNGNVSNDGAKEVKDTISMIDPTKYGAQPDDDQADDAAINAAINDIQDGSQAIIQLPPGHFILDAPIIINKNQITLQGSGKSKTLIDSRFTMNKGSAAILISGDKGTKIGELDNDAKKGDKLLLLTIDPEFEELFQKASYIWLGAPNSREFLNEIGSENWDKPYPWLRQTIAGLENAKDDVAWLADPLILDLPKGAEVYVPNLIIGSTIKDMEIIQTVQGLDPSQVKGEYENSAPEYAVDGIRLNWSANSQVKNVKITYAGRHPLLIENSYKALIKKINVDGAWNKGSEGNGYVSFSRAYYCLLEESKIRRIRHLAFQWSAAGNVVKNCTINTDVNFHGGFSHDNLVEHCVIKPPKWHPWEKVTRMPEEGGEWAPKDGEGNIVRNIVTEITE